ncbi:hypothetical protein [Candidatus Pelagibacter sp. HIMB1611]|uniref:hypothetical protein n=1 Tax=unclassified Candidatus Pelagibacter TaxID=2647897 RepID=UPI003F83A3A6
MNDILILIIQVSLILSFFSSNLVLQNIYGQKKIELNPDIIINLNLILILSFFNFDVIYFFVLIIALNIFLVFKNKGDLLSTLVTFLIIFFFIFTISIAIFRELKLGWDAQEFHIFKTIILFNSGTFFDLQNTIQNNIPHLGHSIWAFFWRISIIDHEVFGRISYVTIFIFVCYRVVIKKKITFFNFTLLTLFIFLSYDHEQFNGYQEILLFSFILLASDFILDDKKKLNSINTIIFLLLLNLIIWTKQEGIFISLILSTILFFKIKNKKNYSYLVLGNLLLIVFQISIFYFSTGHYEIQTSDYSGIFNNFFSMIFDIERYYFILIEYCITIIQYPIILVVLIYVFSKEKLRDKEKMLLSFTILSILFCMAAYIFTNHNSGYVYHIKTSMSRFIYSISAFYWIYFLDEFSLLFKKKFNEINFK